MAVIGTGSGKKLEFVLVCRTSDDELVDRRISFKNGEFCPDIKADVWARINEARPVFFLDEIGLLVMNFGASFSGLRVNI